MNQSSFHSMYFAAIVCPAQVNEKVLQFKHWMKERFGCVVALKSPAHITLIPPFWFQQEKENELLQALQSFKSGIAIQEIELDSFLHFGKRVLYVHVKENLLIGEIKNQVEKHFMEKIAGSIKKDDRPFHPHITIANRDMKPSHFEKAWEYFSNKEFKETFYTNTISLLRLNPGKWDVIGENSWLAQS